MRTLSFLGLDAAERPRLNATSIRQLARLGTVVRWPGLLFAAILALAVPPKSPIGLGLVLVWVTVYNAWGMIAISKADDRSILRVGRALTLLDTLSYFLVLFVFGGVGASTSIYAAYILLIVWMVAYDGAEGAMLVVGIFVVGMIALHAALQAVSIQDFPTQVVLFWSLIMVVAGAILAAYDRIVIGGVLPQTQGNASDGSRPGAALIATPAAAPMATPTVAPMATPTVAPIATPTVAQVAVTSASAPAVRLSPREQEVLQLVSEGYSNSMIAARLHLSENTIKTYVENLLTRLNARNRAEAVAAASRQNLI
jgi:DNA-binding CsgD family transcriptional regulator